MRWLVALVLLLSPVSIYGFGVGTVGTQWQGYVAGGGGLLESVGTQDVPTDLVTTFKIDESYSFRVAGTPTASGTLTSLSIYADGNAGGEKFKLSLYSDDSGNRMPDELLATSVEGTLTADMALYELDFDTGSSTITSGTQYWVVIEFLDPWSSVGSGGWVAAGEYHFSMKTNSGSYAWPTWGGTENAEEDNADVSAYFTYSY